MLHVDGEGMADPPYPRLFPENLVNHNDGPPMYNLRATFNGTVAGPPGYAVDEAAWGGLGDSFDWRSVESATNRVPPPPQQTPPARAMPAYAASLPSGDPRTLRERGCASDACWRCARSLGARHPPSSTQQSSAQRSVHRCPAPPACTL